MSFHWIRQKLGFNQHFYYWLMKLALLVLVYSVMRLGFLAHNWSAYASVSLGDLLRALLLGLRFDISAVLFLSLPAFVFVLLPLKATKKSLKVLNLFVFLPHVLFIYANCAEIEYSNFTGNRMTFAILNLKSDLSDQAGQIVLNFWPLFLFACILSFIVFRYPRYPTVSLYKNQKHSRVSLIVIPFLLAIYLVGIRGGVQSKPLKPIYAFTMGQPKMGLLALNTTITMIHGRKDSQLREKSYFNSSAELSPLLYPIAEYKSPIRKNNVILIILESFATEFWGAANDGVGHTPFLDSLVKDSRSRFFEFHFANGRRSMDALPSLLLGIPNLMEGSIAKSSFYANDWYGVGRVLGSNGFSTAFFHGARKGSMYFDAVSSLAGVKLYRGLEDYSGDEQDYDGTWGIFDEPYLQYVSQELSGLETPFFASVFTLSSHNPYPIPEKYKGRWPDGELPIHKSIRYVDYSLKEFFKTANRQPWFKNTIFIITADHTEKSNVKMYSGPIGRYRVPLLLYSEGFALPPSNPLRVTQHADILPTIFDLLQLSPEKSSRMGASVFSALPGHAIFQSSQNYWYVEANRYAHRNVEGEIRVYDLNQDPLQTSPLALSPQEKNAYKRKIEAQIQHFNNGLIKNQLYQ